MNVCSVWHVVVLEEMEMESLSSTVHDQNHWPFKHYSSYGVIMVLLRGSRQA